MPARAKRPCRHKGCAAVTNDASGYCDQHRQRHAGDGWRNYQAGKSRQERGYGRTWEIKRVRILQRDKYLCQNHRRQKIAKRRPALTTSFQKLMAVLMTISILSRCAGTATERRRQESVSDELDPLHIFWFTALYNS